MLKIDVGSRLAILATSINCGHLFKTHPHIELHQRKRPTNQTTTIFVNEQDYEWPHTDDNILDIEGQHPTKQVVTKCLR